MPYTKSNPPSRIKGLPDYAQEIWISAYNSAWEAYDPKKSKAPNREAYANSVAWSAVKEQYVKQGGRWMKKRTSAQVQPHGPHECECPKCGKTVTVEEDVKCQTLKCPDCGTRMRGSGQGERRSEMKERATAAATDAEKKAQKARSKQYGISIRADGNVTKPKEWSHVPDGQFGDPVNYSYPCPDADQTRAALRYWGKAKNKAKYSSKDQAIITRRLEGFAKKFDISPDRDKERGEAEVSYPGRVIGAVQGKEGTEWDIVLVEAGLDKNDFYWDPEVLRRDAHVLEGAKSYDMHLTDEEFKREPRRKFGELLGVVKNVAWDSTIGKMGGLAGVYHAIDEGIRKKLLALEGAGALDTVGLSVDSLIGAGMKDVGGRAVRSLTALRKAIAVDVVGDPAAGGRFRRAIASEEDIMGMSKDELEALVEERVAAALEAAKPGDEELPQKEEEEDEAARKARETLEQAQRVACGTLLDTKLQASKLPQPFQEIVRAQFADKIFEAKELDEAIRVTAEAIAESSKTGDVEGAGGRVTVGASSLEQLQWAADRLFGAEIPEKASDIPRLSGIKELYLLLTGDYDMRGIFQPDNIRVSAANVNTGTVTSLVKNALNKVLLREYNALEPWWRPIITEMDHTSMQQVTLIKTGSIPELPTVGEGAAYQELSFGDVEETSDWVKKGAYIGVTLEAIDRDDVGGIRRIPRELGRAARRTLSSAIAAIFTSDSATGPTMADGYHLFDASNHGNLLTAALSAAEWETVVKAMFKQTAPVGGQRLGMRPRFCLVPIDLDMTARRIFEQPWEQTDEKHFETLLRGAATVIAVPEWVDVTDWAAVVDPAVCDGICLGYRFGREPEMFTADDPKTGSMFTNDEMRIKVRFFWTLGVADYRPLHKSNVAG